MPSIFIVVIFAFLLGQRADGQDDAPPQECLDAFTQIVEACGMGDPGVNICSGDCGDAYEDAIRVCGEFGSAQQMLLDQFCNDGGGNVQACIAAGNAIGMSERCSNISMAEVSMITDSDCTACRSLFETLVSACGSTIGITQADINEACGGAGTLTTLGVYTVVLVSMIAAVIS